MNSLLLVSIQGRVWTGSSRRLAQTCRHARTPPRRCCLSSLALAPQQQQQRDEVAPAIVTTDVLIVGGGVVGCALMDQIQTLMPHLSVGLVDAGKGPPSRNKENTTQEAGADDAAFLIPHPRSYALSPASLQLLGLVSNNNNNNDSSLLLPSTKNRLGFYDSMQVWEQQQPACLSFSTADLMVAADHESTSNTNSPTTATCLGAVVEDSVLMQELWSRITSRNMANHSLHFESTIQQVQLPFSASEGLVQVHLGPSNHSHQTSKKRMVQTRLLVAADGADSVTRNMLGIPLSGWDYGRQALTFTVQLADADSNNQQTKRRAFQRFLPTGPIALLPTHSPQHAIVVWSTTPQQVQQWKHHPDLAQHVNRLLQQGPEQLEPLFTASSNANNDNDIISNLLYGMDKLVETIQYGPALLAQYQQQSAASFCPPPIIATICSPQFSFPLSCRHCAHYTKPRFCLVGDAAHTVHPMAGQGLNLGLNDVECLVRTMIKAVRAGMDVSTFVTTDYEPSRQTVVSTTLYGIHALHGMFGQNHVLARHVKSLGMNVIQTVGPLKRALVQAACQGVAI